MTEQTVGWALHALEPDEEIAAVEHMESCAECRRTAAEVAEVATGMATAVEQRDPPPGLRASILEEAARTPQQRPSTPRAEPARVDPRSESRSDLDVEDRRRPARPGPSDGRPPSRGPGRFGLQGRRRLVAAVAAIAVLAGGGVLIGYAQQMRTERDQSIAQAQDIFEAVARIDRPGATHAFLAPPTPDAQPVAAVMVDGNERMVINMDLRPNAVDDQTYVLWGMTDPRATPQPVGTFDVTPTPGSPISVPSTPGGSFAMYAVSLEKGRQAPASPSSVMAIGQVET